MATFHHKIKKYGGGHDESCSRFCCTKIEDFSVSYGDLDVIKNVNIHIHCGQLTAVIGPNGAGKSTLLKAILGEVPHSGRINYVSGDGRHAPSPRIGYVPQYLQFDLSTPATVEDFFFAALSNKPVWLWPPLEKFLAQITHKKYAPPLRERILNGLQRVKAEDLLDRRLGKLSGGELQRVLLALALDPKPELLLLDEPVSGVDHDGLKIFYEILDRLRQEEDMAVLLVSHDLKLVARYADQVIFLSNGVITHGEPETVFADERVKSIFGNIDVDK